MINVTISFEQMLKSESVKGSTALEYFEDVESSIQKTLRRELKSAEEYFIRAEQTHYSDSKNAIEDYKKALTGFIKVAKGYESAGKKKYGSLFFAALSGSSFAQLASIGINVALIHGANKKIYREQINLASGDLGAVDRAHSIKNRAENTSKTINKIASGVGAGIGAGAMSLALKSKIKKTGDYLAKRIIVCKEAIDEFGGKYSANENIVSELSPIAQKIYTKALEEIDMALDSVEHIKGEWNI